MFLVIFWHSIGNFPEGRRLWNVAQNGGKCRIFHIRYQYNLARRVLDLFHLVSIWPKLCYTPDPQVVVHWSAKHLHEMFPLCLQTLLNSWQYFKVFLEIQQEQLEYYTPIQLATLAMIDLYSNLNFVPDFGTVIWILVDRWSPSGTSDTLSCHLMSCQTVLFHSGVSAGDWNHPPRSPDIDTAHAHSA